MSSTTHPLTKQAPVKGSALFAPKGSESPWNMVDVKRSEGEILVILDQKQTETRSKGLLHSVIFRETSPMILAGESN